MLDLDLELYCLRSSSLHRSLRKLGRRRRDVLMLISRRADKEIGTVPLFSFLFQYMNLYMHLCYLRWRTVIWAKNASSFVFTEIYLNICLFDRVRIKKLLHKWQKHTSFQLINQTIFNTWEYDVTKIVEG